MKSDLASVDVAIVVLYLLGTTLMGAWFARRQRDLRVYFVGDRDVSGWLILVSIVATETSTVTFLSVPGLAFRRPTAWDPEPGNLTFLQLSFGYIVGRMLIAWLLLPQYLRGELFSAYELLRQRFNPAVQRTASGLFLLTRAIADGLRLYLAALLLEQFTGWNSQISVLIIGVATMIYTYLGGMQAVIWTDLVQFAIYIAGAVVAAFFILHRVEGGLDGFLSVGQQEHKFHLLDFSGDLSRPFTFWAGLIGGAFFTMASHGADQMMVQRYLCSRSLRQARRALIASGFVVLVQFLLFLLIGVGLNVLFRQGLLRLPTDIKDDAVFGYFIVRFLPSGIVGVLIAAVLAASMSSLSSSLNSSASAFTSDFYRPLRPGRDESHYLLVSRLMTTVWGLTRIVVALAAVSLMRDRNVITQVLLVAGFTTGMILGLFVLGSLKRRVSSQAALVGLVIGFLIVFLVWLPSAASTNLLDWLGMVWGQASIPWPLAVWAAYPLAWPWYAVIGTVSTVLMALVVDFLGTGHGSSANRGTKPSLDKPG
jgi:SSS family transporter